jgi:hypothetical protein
MDFFSWLNRRDNTGLYPIGSRSVLTEIFNKYRARYGATQKVKKFFNSLSPDWHWVLTKGVRAFKYPVADENGEPEEVSLSIDDIANYLYQIRSNFVHSVDVIHELDRGFGFSTRGNMRYMTRLSVDELAYIFEAGILSHFRFEPDYPMGKDDQVKLLYPRV